MNYSSYAHDILHIQQAQKCAPTYKKVSDKTQGNFTVYGHYLYPTLKEGTEASLQFRELLIT